MAWGSRALRLAESKTDSDQKQVWVCETDWWAWNWSEHFHWKLSIQKYFLNAKNCFPIVRLTGMKFPMRQMKAFCLKAFLFSMKLIKKKISEQNKILKPWDVSLNVCSDFQLVLNYVMEKVTLSWGTFHHVQSLHLALVGQMHPRLYFTWVLRQKPGIIWC